DSFQVETFGEPKTVVLDFQKDVVDYARDRSSLQPNQLTMEALEGMVHTMDASLLVAHAGVLFELATHFERRLPAFARSLHLHLPSQTLKERIEKELGRYPFIGKTVVAQNPQLQSAVNMNEARLLFLPKALIPESASRHSLIARS